MPSATRTLFEKRVLDSQKLLIRKDVYIGIKMERIESFSDLVKKDHNDEEPPPILKSWKNLYILVLGNLLLWITLFAIFTWTFK